MVFEVTASGDVLDYMWERQVGRSLLQNSRVTGVKTDRLTVRNVQATDSGVYTCEVSNDAGSATSRAVLTVGELFISLHSFINKKLLANPN